VKLGGGTKNPKLPKVDEAALTRAEFHSCKAAALVAGVCKVLSDELLVGSHWPNDITIDVATELLAQARNASQAAHSGYQAATRKKSKRS